MPKLIAITFIVGDENENGKVDATASVEVAGNNVFSKTVDIDPASAFRLVAGAAKVVGPAVARLKDIFK